MEKYIFDDNTKLIFVKDNFIFEKSLNKIF